MLMKFSDENVRPCAMTTTFHTSDRYFASVTIGTITIMSIERWLHMSRRSLITVRLAYVIYGMLLVLAAVLTGARIWLILVKNFQEGWEPVLRGVLGGLCFLTISLSYFEVFKLIRRHQQQVQASQSSWSTVQPSMNLAKYKKSVYTILLILVVFLLCLVPNIICMSVIFLLNMCNKPFAIVYHVSFTLFYMSSALNPLLYCCRIKEIGHEVRLRIKKVICKGWQNINFTLLGAPNLDK